MKQNLASLGKSIARGVRLARTPMGVGRGGSLVEAKGFKELVEDIADPIKQATTALMLENYREYRGTLDEATSTLQIGSYDKWAFPLLTYIAENNIAQDLVSVQPMEGPTGNVFYMNFVTGQAKGSTPKGAKILDARTAKSDRYTDSAPRVDGEILVSAGASGLDAQSLTYLPVTPGSVTFVIDPSGSAVELSDNGNGAIITSASAVVGAIDYSTGTISGSTGVLAATAGTAIEIGYDYHSELNDTAQMVDFEIQSAPIVAKERKLRARWTQEAALTLKALFDEDAESVITNAITSTIKWEIDREILEDLRLRASAGTVTWSGNAPTNVSYVEHKLTFNDAVMAASNYIHRSTNLARANWAVSGTSGSNVIETLPNFDPASNVVEVEGVVEVGKLGHIRIFVDPHFPVNEVTLGYKGTNDLVRTGYIFAPWVLLYTTPLVQMDDFLSRKGLASIYGKKSVNSKFYSRIVITNPAITFGA